MKSLIPALLLFSIYLFGCKNKIEPKDERPNIILIMADDMGYSDLGFFGSGIETPNIDRLAGNGLVMTSFYNTSRCCPTRASLLTGLYQHQAGIGCMNHDLGYPSYQGFLNDSCVTIAEVLKDAGYTTLMTGKWHVGDKKENWPINRGFDRFYGVPRGGGVYFYPFKKDRDVVLDSTIQKVDSATFYSTEAFNNYAVKFIKDQKSVGKPFFLYVAHIAPHFPLQALPEDIEKYRGKFMEGFQVLRERRFKTMKEKGLIPENIVLSQPDNRVEVWDNLSDSEKDEYDLRMAIYAAQLDRMDKGISKIIDVLEEQNIIDNTVIMFLSDNGGTSEWVHREGAKIEDYGTRNSWESYSASWANVSNTPFRMYKHWVHEGGISTPFIIHYPKLIKEHRIDDQVAHVMDIMPTCIELAETKYPELYNNKFIKPVEGKSILPILRGGERIGYEALFWEHMGNRAVRKGKWKLVSQFPQNEWMLYDIETDRVESQNLASKFPEKVKELEGEYKNWAKRSNVIKLQKLK